MLCDLEMHFKWFVTVIIIKVPLLKCTRICSDFRNRVHKPSNIVKHWKAFNGKWHSRFGPFFCSFQIVLAVFVNLNQFQTIETKQKKIIVRFRFLKMCHYTCSKWQTEYTRIRLNNNTFHFVVSLLMGQFFFEQKGTKIAIEFRCVSLKWRKQIRHRVMKRMQMY